MRIICLIFCLLIVALLPAQTETSWPPAAVDVLAAGSISRSAQRDLARALRKASDSTQVQELSENWCKAQVTNGYLECWVEGWEWKGERLTVSIFSGPRYFHRSVQLEGLNALYLQKAGLDRLVKKQAAVDWEGLENRLAQVADQFQQEGYPFAAFDDLQLSYTAKGADSILTDISYRFSAGPVITIDSIRIQGNPREQDRFIHDLTRLYPGDVYQQRLIDDIPRLLNNSIYYRNVPAPKVVFTAYNTAHLNIKLEKAQTSKFDVLLGILPPASATQSDQSVQITGTVDVLLVSPFRQGEILQFKFDKLTSTSQQTQLRLQLPYLLRTPLRLEGDFNLLKQEEDFLNLNVQLGGRYAFSPTLSATFAYQLRNSRLLGEAVADTTSLDQIDGNRQSGSVGFLFDNLDYRLNPSKGVFAQVNLGLGQRTIRENPQLLLRNPEIYEDVIRNQPTREIQLDLQWFKSLWPRHVLHLRNRTYYLGMNQYFRNDQLQVGGAKSLRGFNENAFFTDFFSQFTAEYRLQLERNSFLFFFGDYAYLQNRVSNQILRPTGLGLGMNYGTKAGIISISYAVGRTAELAFNPGRGRIHVGLVNQF
ncbi:MAG: BamA/TamA family outer membrane protein [Bacteroidota bacterium]